MVRPLALSLVPCASLWRDIDFVLREQLAGGAAKLRFPVVREEILPVHAGASRGTGLAQTRASALDVVFIDVEATQKRVGKTLRCNQAVARPAEFNAAFIYMAATAW